MTSGTARPRSVTSPVALSEPSLPPKRGNNTTSKPTPARKAPAEDVETVMDEAGEEAAVVAEAVPAVEDHPMNTTAKPVESTAPSHSMMKPAVSTAPLPQTISMGTYATRVMTTTRLRRVTLRRVPMWYGAPKSTSTPTRTKIQSTPT